MKKVYKAKTDSSGKLRFDNYGEPIIYPRKNYVVDEEAGFYVGFQDVNDKGEWKIIKMMQHPMGYTVMADGKYDLSSHDMKLAVQTNHHDSPYQVYMSPYSKNMDYGHDYDIKEYEAHLQVCKGHKYCDGDYCKRKPRLETQEYVKVDIHAEYKDDLHMIRRRRAVYTKASDKTVPLFERD